MRYRGTVEQVRRELREQGHSVPDARRMAPDLADRRQIELDERVKPFGWLGARANERATDLEVG